MAERRQPRHGRRDSCRQPSTRGGLGGLQNAAVPLSCVASPSKAAAGAGQGHGTTTGSRFGNLAKHRGTSSKTRGRGQAQRHHMPAKDNFKQLPCYICVCVGGRFLPTELLRAPCGSLAGWGGQLSPAWPGVPAVKPALPRWPRGGREGLDFPVLCAGDLHRGGCRGVQGCSSM